jgi:alkylation response protein AidB-like acyl-CoA dehydrogenase
MDFRFGEREEGLRNEVRRFLQEQLGGPATGQKLGPESEEQYEFARAFNSELGRRGWLAAAWPAAYGGRDASIYEQMVVNEELGYFGAPDTGTRSFGVGMIGPTLIVHGNEEQKRQYLPRITSGEHIWCQGYSEPGAGSDLASLQTRAERDGDEYVINGQKIWTSGGHGANQMFCLVRTDPEAPKHRGITFLLIDDIQQQPGLTIRPLVNMASHHHFNEVFFENVRVPVRNRLGEENRGWYVGMTLLEFERSGIAGTASQRRTLQQLTAHLSANPGRRAQYRVRLADLAVANQVGRCICYRIGYAQQNGIPVTYEASLAKVYQSELAQRIANFAVSVLGVDGLLLPGQPRAPLGGMMPEMYMNVVPGTIYSGSNEIQRNIIAQRGLGLPRD